MLQNATCDQMQNNRLQVYEKFLPKGSSREPLSFE